MSIEQLSQASGSTEQVSDEAEHAEIIIRDMDKMLKAVLKLFYIYNKNGYSAKGFSKTTFYRILNEAEQEFSQRW